MPQNSQTADHLLLVFQTWSLAVPTSGARGWQRISDAVGAMVADPSGAAAILWARAIRASSTVMERSSRSSNVIMERKSVDQVFQVFQWPTNANWISYFQARFPGWF